MIQFKNDSLERLYFDFLCKKVGIATDEKATDALKYRILARKLFQKDFYWVVPLDQNRSVDAYALRDAFVNEVILGLGGVYGSTVCEVDEFSPDSYIYGPVSVLEVLVALADRIEKDIMYDNDEGDRTSQWFFLMIAHLDLLDCTDEAVNEVLAAKIDRNVEKMLDREYDYYGEGGLWPLKTPAQDQREVDIWYQVNFWLGENGWLE